MKHKTNNNIIKMTINSKITAIEIMKNFSYFCKNYNKINK
jgi:hypothetical protein